VLVAALTAAFARGGRNERLGGALLLVASLASPLVQVNMFADLELGIALVDTLLFMALLALAFASDHRWPTVAAAFQAIAVLTHLARFKAGEVHGDVYGNMLVLWSYPVALSLLWGSLSRSRKCASSGIAAQVAPALAFSLPNDMVPASNRRSPPATSDLALLTQLLKLHDPGSQSDAMAAALIGRVGSFAAAVATPATRLRAWGFDEGVAEALAFARITTRSNLRRKLETRPSLANGEEAVDYLFSELAHLPHEQFRVLYLNSRYRLIYDEVHGEGTVTEAAVFPREIVKRAMEAGAVYVILAHNHPGGDPAPSRADIITTRAIIEATRSIGVAVIDHIVVSTSGHVSMRAAGLI
jgi:DNA repair protein RadC